MKRVKRIGSLLMMLGAGVLFFTACDDDDDPIVLDGYADVFVQKTKVGDVEKYAPVFYVGANKNLTSVTVTAPGEEAKQYELEKYWNSENNFRYLPVEADFSDVMLAAGEYTFELVSTDEADVPLILKDNIEEGELGALEGVVSVFEDGQMKTAWTALEGAESYLVKLYDADGELVFFSQPIKDDATEYAFSVSSQGWLNSGSVAQDGETYTLELTAFMYEEGVMDSQKVYNVQFASVDKQEVVWGSQPANE